MAALHSGQCFLTATDAADSAWSSVAPVLDSGGLVRFPFKSGSDWYLGTYDGPTLVASVAAPTIGFPVCDPAESVALGIELAWYVVVVWAATWAVRIIGRRFLGG